MKRNLKIQNKWEMGCSVGLCTAASRVTEVKNKQKTPTNSQRQFLLPALSTLLHLSPYSSSLSFWPWSKFASILSPLPFSFSPADFRENIVSALVATESAVNKALMVTESWTEGSVVAYSFICLLNLNFQSPPNLCFLSLCFRRTWVWLMLLNNMLLKAKI